MKPTASYPKVIRKLSESQWQVVTCQITLEGKLPDLSLRNEKS